MISISCLESKLLNNNNWYGRFQLAPFQKGEGLTVANALRRTLLAEKSNFFITWVDFYNAEIPYSVLTGMRESVFDILLNLKQVIFTSDKIIPNSSHFFKMPSRNNFRAPKEKFFSGSAFGFKRSHNNILGASPVFSVLEKTRSDETMGWNKIKKSNLQPKINFLKESGLNIIPKTITSRPKPKNQDLRIDQKINHEISKSFPSSLFLVDKQKTVLRPSLNQFINIVLPMTKKNGISKTLKLQNFKNQKIHLKTKTIFSQNQLLGKIINPDHETSILPLGIFRQNNGLKDPFLNISNSKNLLDSTYIGYICAKGPATIYAKNIKLPKGLKCVDPDKYIVTLADDGLFYLRFALTTEIKTLPLSEASNVFLSINQGIKINTVRLKTFPKILLNQEIQSCFNSRIDLSMLNRKSKNSKSNKQDLTTKQINFRSDIKSIENYYKQEYRDSNINLVWSKPIRWRLNLPKQKYPLFFSKPDSTLSVKNLQFASNIKFYNSKMWPSHSTKNLINEQRLLLTNDSIKQFNFQNTSMTANIQKTCLLNIQIKHYYYKCGRFDRFLFDLIKSFKPNVKSIYKPSLKNQENIFYQNNDWRILTEFHKTLERQKSNSQLLINSKGNNVKKLKYLPSHCLLKKKHIINKLSNRFQSNLNYFSFKHTLLPLKWGRHSRGLLETGLENNIGLKFPSLDLNIFEDYLLKNKYFGSLIKWQKIFKSLKTSSIYDYFQKLHTSQATLIGFLQLKPNPESSISLLNSKLISNMELKAERLFLRLGVPVFIYENCFRLCLPFQEVSRVNKRRDGVKPNSDNFYSGPKLPGENANKQGSQFLFRESKQELTSVFSNKSEGSSGFSLSGVSVIPPSLKWRGHVPSFFVETKKERSRVFPASDPTRVLENTEAEFNSRNYDLFSIDNQFINQICDADLSFKIKNQGSASNKYQHRDRKLFVSKFHEPYTQKFLNIYSSFQCLKNHILYFLKSYILQSNHSLSFFNKNFVRVKNISCYPLFKFGYIYTKKLITKIKLRHWSYFSIEYYNETKILLLKKKMYFFPWINNSSLRGQIKLLEFLSLNQNKTSKYDNNLREFLYSRKKTDFRSSMSILEELNNSITQGSRLNSSFISKKASLFLTPSFWPLLFKEKALKRRGQKQLSYIKTERRFPLVINHQRKMLINQPYIYLNKNKSKNSLRISKNLRAKPCISIRQVSTKALSNVSIQTKQWGDNQPIYFFPGQFQQNTNRLLSLLDDIKFRDFRQAQRNKKSFFNFSYMARETTKTFNSIINNSVVLKPIYLNVEQIIYILKQTNKFRKNQRINPVFFYSLTRLNNTNRYPLNYSLIFSKGTGMEISNSFFRWRNTWLCFFSDENPTSMLKKRVHKKGIKKKELISHRLIKNSLGKKEMVKQFFFTYRPLLSFFKYYILKKNYNTHNFTDGFRFSVPPKLGFAKQSMYYLEALNKNVQPNLIQNNYFPLLNIDSWLGADSRLKGSQSSPVIYDPLVFSFEEKTNKEKTRCGQAMGWNPEKNLYNQPYNINIYHSKISFNLRYTYPFKYTIFETFLTFLNFSEKLWYIRQNTDLARRFFRNRFRRKRGHPFSIRIKRSCAFSVSQFSKNFQNTNASIIKTLNLNTQVDKKNSLKRKEYGFNNSIQNFDDFSFFKNQNYQVFNNYKEDNGILNFNILPFQNFDYIQYHESFKIYTTLAYTCLKTYDLHLPKYHNFNRPNQKKSQNSNLKINSFKSPVFSHKVFSLREKTNWEKTGGLPVLSYKTGKSHPSSLKREEGWTPFLKNNENWISNTKFYYQKSSAYPFLSIPDQLPSIFNSAYKWRIMNNSNFNDAFIIIPSTWSLNFQFYASHNLINLFYLKILASFILPLEKFIYMDYNLKNIDKTMFLNTFGQKNQVPGYCLIQNKLHWSRTHNKNTEFNWRYPYSEKSLKLMNSVFQINRKNNDAENLDNSKKSSFLVPKFKIKKSLKTLAINFENIYYKNFLWNSRKITLRLLNNAVLSLVANRKYSIYDFRPKKNYQTSFAFWLFLNQFKGSSKTSLNKKPGKTIIDLIHKHFHAENAYLYGNKKTKLYQLFLSNQFSKIYNYQKIPFYSIRHKILGTTNFMCSKTYPISKNNNEIQKIFKSPFLMEIPKTSRYKNNLSKTDTDRALFDKMNIFNSKDYFKEETTPQALSNSLQKNLPYSKNEWQTQLSNNFFSGVAQRESFLSLGYKWRPFFSGSLKHSQAPPVVSLKAKPWGEKNPASRSLFVNFETQKKERKENSENDLLSGSSMEDKSPFLSRWVKSAAFIEDPYRPEKLAYIRKNQWINKLIQGSKSYNSKDTSENDSKSPFISNLWSSSFFCRYSLYAISIKSDLFLQNLLSFSGLTNQIREASVFSKKKTTEMSDNWTPKHNETEMIQTSPKTNSKNFKKSFRPLPFEKMQSQYEHSSTNQFLNVKPFIKSDNKIIQKILKSQNHKLANYFVPNYDYHWQKAAYLAILRHFKRLKFNDKKKTISFNWSKNKHNDWFLDQYPKKSFDDTSQNFINILKNKYSIRRLKNYKRYFGNPLRRRISQNELSFFNITLLTKLSEEFRNLKFKKLNQPILKSWNSIIWTAEANRYFCFIYPLHIQNCNLPWQKSKHVFDIPKPWLNRKFIDLKPSFELIFSNKKLYSGSTRLSKTSYINRALNNNLFFTYTQLSSSSNQTHQPLLHSKVFKNILSPVNRHMHILNKGSYKIIGYFTIKESLNSIYKVNYIVESQTYESKPMSQLAFHSDQNNKISRPAISIKSSDTLKKFENIQPDLVTTDSLMVSNFFNGTYSFVPSKTIILNSFNELVDSQINRSKVENENEYIQIDIWTNGELSPRQALLNAFRKLFELFYNLSKYNCLKPLEI